MSRMIPPIIHRGCQSGGEKRVFTAFKEAIDTDDWVVLHSVGIAKHTQRLTGEIDFLVIIPSEGIICIEVKGGAVSCDKGIWHYPYGKSSRSPFAQCSDSMHSIRNYIAEKDHGLTRLLITSAVIFTDVDLSVSNPEWHPWQNIGVSKLGGTGMPYLARVCRDILQRAHEDIAETVSAKWYDGALSRPSNQQMNKLAEVLRPEFEFFVSAKQQIDSLDYSIMRFTREQFRVLDLVRQYPRAGFTGPAGTGKTLLALECVRREVECGNRTALFCFNKALGR